MKLDEFLRKPKNMDVKEYENLLRLKSCLETRIQTYSNKIHDEKDSLAVLSDEIGSERYLRHLEVKCEYEEKRVAAWKKLREIKNRLSKL